LQNENKFNENWFNNIRTKSCGSYCGNIISIIDELFLYCQMDLFESVGNFILKK